MPKPASIPARRVAVSAALLTSIVVMPGCPYATQALFGRSDDYDRRVSLARLRNVDRLALDAAAEQTPDGLPGLENERAKVDAARAAFEQAEKAELTIEEVRAATLENNLNLQVALIAPTIAQETVNEEEGRFEALLFANAQLRDSDDAVASTLDSAQSRQMFFQPGIRVPLRTGGQVEVSTPISRLRTDNQFTFLNPAYTADLQLSLSQNLLRGAGRRANTFQIRVADIDRQVSEAQTKLEVIRQVAAADRAYWRLYAARQELLVRFQQYELAVDQLERAGRRFEAGQVAEIEVVRAESGLADRVESIITAQNTVLLRQRALKALINIPGLDVESETFVITMSDPDPVRYDLNGPSLAAAALDQRMEMLELELQLARDAAAIAFQKNQALPLLAMNFTYRINGLGGSLSESVRQASEIDFEDYEVGLQAEIPLGNEQRRAAVERAVLSRLQRLSTREARAQAIRQEVLDAVDQIDSGWQRIRAAQQAVALNTRALRAEERQFDVGRSTSNDVLEADTRLAEARLTEISAVVEYQIAQVDLAFATGTLLGASRVEWEPTDPRN